MVFATALKKIGDEVSNNGSQLIKEDGKKAAVAILRILGSLLK